MVLPDSPEGRLIFDHPSAGSAEEQVSFSGACATGYGCGKSEVFKCFAHEETSTLRFIVLPNATGPEPAVALFPKSRWEFRLPISPTNANFFGSRPGRIRKRFGNGWKLQPRREAGATRGRDFGRPGSTEAQTSGGSVLNFWRERRVSAAFPPALCGENRQIEIFNPSNRSPPSWS